MSEKSWSLYKHTCPDGKIYVGITSQRVEDRWLNGFGYKENRYFFSAIVKYGWDNIIHQVIQKGLTEQEARENERNMIKSLGDKSYNLVHRIKENVNFSVPSRVFDERDYSADDVTAIRLWCVAAYGDIEDEHMREVADGAFGWERTVWEFASGDYERIVREMLFIDKQRAKRLGLEVKEYSDDEIKKLAKKLSGTVLERYTAVKAFIPSA